MILSRLTSILLVFSLLSFAFGCGGQKEPEGLPKRFPLSITIKQDGKPLPEASLTLKAENGGSGQQWPVGGVTDANGVAKINTYGSYAGAPEGKYTVLVSKETIVYTDESKLNVEKFIHTVDQKYLSVNTSDLKLDFSTGQPATAEFDVGAPVSVERSANP